MLYAEKKLCLYVLSEVVDSDWCGVPTLYGRIGANFGSHLLVHKHLVQSGTPRRAGGDRLSMGKPADASSITAVVANARVQLIYKHEHRWETPTYVTETFANVLHITCVTDSI